MDYIKELETLGGVISDQLSDITRKVKNSGMSSGDLDTIDKLAHALKSIKAVKAMMEDDDGYSSHYPYAYGRGRNARRDSMGRYSGEYGYSRSDLADKMRELMHDAPDDRTRQEMKRLIENLDNA